MFHLPRWTIAVGLSAVLLLAPHPAEPQPAPAAPYVALSVIDVKPDMMAEFGALQAEVAAAQKAGGQPWRETWHTATFGYPYRVAVVVPIEFPQLDGTTFTVKGAGAAAATAINERARRMIAGQHIYLLRLRPDLGHGARPAAAPKLAIATTVRVAPGRAADFERIVTDVVVPALQKAGTAYYGVSQVVLGGDTNTYVTTLLAENFTEMGQGHPLERALGADGLAALEQRTAGIVLSVERHIMRYNEALSFRTAPATPSPQR